MLYTPFVYIGLDTRTTAKEPTDGDHATLGSRQDAQEERHVSALEAAASLCRKSGIEPIN